MLRTVRPEDEAALFALFAAIRSEELAMAGWDAALRDLVLRQQFDAHGIIRHAFAEGIEMLLREHCGGNENGHLASIHYSLERRANGDFRFAEPDIAADESVHGFRPFHVRLGIVDGPKLVGCFLVDESAFELALPRGVRLIRVTFLSFASRLD